MTNWKNLRSNPPACNCNVCVKVGSNFETYHFRRLSELNWELQKYPQVCYPEAVPEHAQYVNLDEIV